MESWVQSWRPRTNAFCDFLAHLSKVLRLPRKINARSYEVLHLSRKFISANLKIWGSKVEPLWRNQRPDFLTSLMNMSLVLRRPHEMHLYRSPSNVPRLPMFLKLLQNPHVLLTFDKVHNPHLNVQKCSVPVSFLHFWLQNALRATTASNFSSLIWPDDSTRRLFDPPEPQTIGKTQCFRDFPTFSIGDTIVSTKAGIMWPLQRVL